MRFWLYDEDGVLLRKFWDKAAAERFLLPGYKIVTSPIVKLKKKSATELINLVGEARF